jgi:small subunit ribosomal protein S4e
MLKYALTYREVISILMQHHVLVDGKVRTDKTYPTGFMGMPISLLMHKDTYTHILVADLWCHFLADVISIPKTNENYMLLPSSPNQG